LIGDQAAIAVLGPDVPDERGRAASMAEAVATELASHGYALIVEGDGVVATHAASAGQRSGGTVRGVVWAGAESRLPRGMDLDRQEDGLRGLARTLDLADAVLLIPGGARSATVLLQMWLWGLTPSAPYRQTILLGEGWPDTVSRLADLTGLDARTRAMVTFARDAREAVEALRYYVSPTRRA